MESQAAGESSSKWPDLMENQHQCTNPQCPHRAGETRDKLLTCLREASLPDLNNDRNRFIPRGDVIRIVKAQVVSQMLRFSQPTLEEAAVQETVNRICSEPERCGCGRKWCTGGRLLFAALAMMAAERRIVELFSTSKRSDQLCDSNPDLGNFGDPSYLKQVLTDWAEERMDLFIQLQWQMRSPYFCCLLENDPPRLDGRVSLPWVHRNDGREERSGHFSKVWRVKIHPHHHDMKTNNGYFALKTLKKIEARSHDRTLKIFQDEYNANRGIIIPHTHITPLLAAFHHGDTRCLLFPWADGGSLREFWKKNPPEEDWCNPDWLWEGCLGISEGLLHMHQPPQTQTQPQAQPELPTRQRQGYENENEIESQNETSAPVPQLHADIKPENILCFSTVSTTSENDNDNDNASDNSNDNRRSNGPYILKLADLGLSQPLTTSSNSFATPGSLDALHVESRKILHTLTYRPPEQDLNLPLATQKWDIWCLGCLYLEFITWFLAGHDALGRFQTQREDELDHARASGSGGGECVYEDKFFRVGVRNRVLSRLPRVDVQKSARVKGCVVEHIHALKTNPDCTDDLRRFLHFIETRMLVVDESKRASTGEVVGFFRRRPVTP